MFATVPRMDIIAPLSGVVVPLESIPDPVFAQKMVGDGVSIDPTSNEVLAPISGKVTQLHQARHALAITADNGIEVLVHVGLDTVLLKGDDFSPLVAQGDRVQLGQPVLRFDADAVARKARCLLTEVIITNSGEKVAYMQPASGLVEAGKSVLLSLELIDESVMTQGTQAGEACYSDRINLPNPAGLHARPAAVLANEAKKYAADIRLLRGADEVNAKSVVAIMGLSTSWGEEVQIKATGVDAKKAVVELEYLIADGCGEQPGDAPQPALTAPQAASPTAAPAQAAGEMAGAAASPGLAIGRVVQYRQEAIDVQEIGGSYAQEKARFESALREAAAQIAALKAKIADPSKAQILDAHLALLDDPDLIDLTENLLQAGKSAAFAWQASFASNAAKLEKLQNLLLRERANDVRDVGRRVLALLAGIKQAQIVVPEGSILIAQELTPSDTANFDRSRLLGFCTTSGGATSHVAILARSLGIPAVCGIDEAVLALPEGTQVVIDGTLGLLRIDPDADYLAQVQARIARQQATREQEQATAFNPGSTRDGHRVEVVANIRNADDAREALAAGAEGVGLLRSEFLFDERSSAPSEDEQAAAYQAVAEVLGPERVFVVRTLDVGGDKPLSYLPIPKEDNPFLGLRGIRVSLDQPEMFRTQLRAILRAAPLGQVHIMFPMVASLDEVRAAKAILAEEQQALGHSVKLGVMIEVPSACAIAEVLAREVDFFSIGTNDLTQYTLAMDRGHPKLAKHADALHPAVLRMIAMTVEGAHKHGKWVGVCGGIASDVLAVPVLVGLGVDELSVSVPAIASVKACLSRLTLEECRSLAAEALTLGTAAEVRALLAPTLECKSLMPDEPESGPAGTAQGVQGSRSE